MASHFGQKFGESRTCGPATFYGVPSGLDAVRTENMYVEYLEYACTGHAGGSGCETGLNRTLTGSIHGSIRA